MDQQKLNGIIEKHGKWLRDEEGGERANLCDANLRDAQVIAMRSNHCSSQRSTRLPTLQKICRSAASAMKLQSGGYLTTKQSSKWTVKKR